MTSNRGEYMAIVAALAGASKDPPDPDEIAYQAMLIYRAANEKSNLEGLDGPAETIDYLSDRIGQFL
jgi:hypothetical protein